LFAEVVKMDLKIKSYEIMWIFQIQEGPPFCYEEQTF